MRSAASSIRSIPSTSSYRDGGLLRRSTRGQARSAWPKSWSTVVCAEINPAAGLGILRGGNSARAATQLKASIRMATVKVTGVDAAPVATSLRQQTLDLWRANTWSVSNNPAQRSKRSMRGRCARAGGTTRLHGNSADGCRHGAGGCPVPNLSRSVMPTGSKVSGLREIRRAGDFFRCMILEFSRAADQTRILQLGGSRMFISARRGRRDQRQWMELRVAPVKAVNSWFPGNQNGLRNALDIGTAFRRRVISGFATIGRRRLGYQPFSSFANADDDADSVESRLTNVRRGVAQNGSIGYWIGAALCPPMGYMAEAVAAHTVDLRV